MLASEFWNRFETNPSSSNRVQFAFANALITLNEIKADYAAS